MAGGNLTISPTAIHTVIYTARSYLEQNYNEYKIRKILLHLEIVLPSIQAAVKTAERRASQNSQIKGCLNKLKAAVCNVENVLDDFKAEAIRKKLKGMGKGKVSEFAYSSTKAVKNVIFHDTNLKRLEKAIGRLQLVCYEATNLLGIEMLNDEDAIEGSTNAHRKKTDTCSPKHFLGRNKEIQSILDIIVAHDPSFSEKNEDKRKGKAGATEGEIGRNNWRLGVLPIVGPTGMGKTALAQTIYNDERVKQNFTLQAWVSISDDLCAAELVEETIRSFKLCEPRTNCDSLHILNDQLAAIIRNKKFILVLDDVWDGRMRDSSWVSLWRVLKEGAPGSLVLVTTQCRSIANWMRTFPSITLDALLWDDFWKLFKYYAFGSSKFGEKGTSILPGKQSLLEAIGKAIATKLNRAPLEAVRIGSLLNDRLDVDHWMEIGDSDMWTVYGSSEQITYLGSAFQNLDLEVKQSLLYCAIFPKGYVFNKNKVVQMWISHGFIQPTRMEKIQLEIGITRLEDIGKKMFDMLVDLFFFQEVSENGYVMHRFVRDLAVAVLPDEFCIIDNSSRLIPKFSRHLALNSDNFGIIDGSWYETVFDDNRYETLQTLMFFGDCRDSIGNALVTIFKKSSSLRVLDLSYMRIGANMFLDIFAQLPHLRFLDLSFTGINILPKSICDLCHLEVLNLRGCFFTKLPKRINNLINLRHLYASLKTISLISGIGKLTKLQELEEFSLKSRKGYKIDELRGMKQLRGRLCISNLEYVEKEKEAVESNLLEKNHLDCLVMKWDPNCEAKECYLVIAERLQPPLDILELEILNYPWAHFPSWMKQTQSSRLRHVKIVGGSLEVLPPLGEMPFLKTLILKNLKVKKIDSEFYGSSESVFPLLAELDLIEMVELEEWNVIEGKEMFPHLQKLTVNSCLALKSLPNNLPRSLKELEIINCSEELKKRCTRDGGQDRNKFTCTVYSNY